MYGFLHRLVVLGAVSLFTKPIWEIHGNTFPSDPEIFEFGNPSGPSEPQEPPEKVGGEALPFSGGFWGGEGPSGLPNIDDFRVRGEGFLVISQITELPM